MNTIIEQYNKEIDEAIAEVEAGNYISGRTWKSRQLNGRDCKVAASAAKTTGKVKTAILNSTGKLPGHPERCTRKINTGKIMTEVPARMKSTIIALHTG